MAAGEKKERGRQGWGKKRQRVTEETAGRRKKKEGEGERGRGESWKEKEERGERRER